MDKLNDTLQKKNLGAFYTPEPYVQKSLELVRQAIKRVPEGNDYIILDRCAGTGNLEILMSDEELSHCVLSTIEYYEYKVLLELLGARGEAVELDGFTFSKRVFRLLVQHFHRHLAVVL